MDPCAGRLALNDDAINVAIRCAHLKLLRSKAWRPLYVLLSVYKHDSDMLTANSSYPLSSVVGLVVQRRLRMFKVPGSIPGGGQYFFIIHYLQRLIGSVWVFVSYRCQWVIPFHSFLCLGTYVSVLIVDTHWNVTFAT